MTFSSVDAHSRAELIEICNTACAMAVQQGRAVDLVVPNQVWEQDEKLIMQQIAPLGVHVQTYAQWVSGLWELCGDGSRIVSSLQRQVMLRPIVTAAKLVPSDPSARLVSLFGEFVQEAISDQVHPARDLSDTEKRVCAAVSAYAEVLSKRGLVELAQAEDVLADSELPSRAVVFMGVDLSKPHCGRFVHAVSEQLEVICINRCLQVGEPRLSDEACERDNEQGSCCDGECCHDHDHGHDHVHSHDHDHEHGHRPQELDSLSGRLYTGAGGVVSTGAVRPGEVRGSHIEGEYLVKLVRELQKQGARTNQIAVVFSNPAEAYPHVHNALAAARIPFASEFSLAVARTGLGAAFMELMAFMGTQESDESYAALLSFVSSPYSGVEPSDARALQMHWRERGGSKPEQRVADLLEGFAQGKATPKITRGRLERFAKLYAASPAEKVTLLFENGKRSGLSADVLLDDRAAAGVLLDYLEACEEAGQGPRVDEAANLKVTLTRSYGDLSQALALADSSVLGASRIPYLVFAGLDSSHYPMARQAGPFDEIYAAYGLLRPDDTAVRQRLLLQNLIEATGECFCFYRGTHDAEGSPRCQSALWDELMTAYRGPVDEEGGLPAHELPAALRSRCISLCEQEVFVSGAGPNGSVTQAVQFGEKLSEAAAGLLLEEPDGKVIPFSPTALEDYYRCPYRWFACRKTGFNGMDSAFDSAAQGNLAHAVFERFYKKLKEEGHARVTPQNLGRALELADAALEEQVKADADKPRTGLFIRTEQEKRLIEEIKQSIRDLVERDAEFLPGFVPTYFELSLGKGTGSILEYAGVPVRGKVDRIDVDARGNAVVIDYKLSSLGQGYGLNSDEDLPLRIQTDIYAMLVQRHFDELGEPIKVIGSVYRSYAKNMLRGVYERSIDWGPKEEVKAGSDGLPRPESDETYDEYLVRVESEVAGRMKCLREGNIKPNPIAEKAGVCAYCKAVEFCPRSEE